MDKLLWFCINCKFSVEKISVPEVLSSIFSGDRDKPIYLETSKTCPKCKSPMIEVKDSSPDE